MALTSMRLTQQQQNEEKQELVAPEPPVYAGGLNLYLDMEAMELLGMTAPLDVGQVVQITALAKVVSQSVYEREGKTGEAENDVNMSLQITDMDLVPAKKAVDARTMFPKSKMEA